MTRIRYLLSFAGLTVAASLLAGCAGPMGMGGSHMGGTVSATSQDMTAMCDMHKQMMAGKSDAERRAMVEHHMKNMSPGMRQHMQTMQEHCK